MTHPTELALAHPWSLPLLWALLHGLDYSLTLVGARLRLRRAHEVVDVGGSYELNPLFQKAVDRGRWLSPRFLVTLVGLGALLYLVAVVSSGLEVAWGLGFLLGVLVFTRVAVIGRHLQNIWLFARMARRPESVTGRIAYDRPTVYGLAFFSHGQTAALLGVAAVVAPDPWLVGGAAGTGLIALAALLLGALRRGAGPKGR